MAPKITLKDLYGERGAMRFTKHRNPANERANVRYPHGTTAPGVPAGAEQAPRVRPFIRVPGTPIPGGTPEYPGFAGGFAGFDGTDRGALDAKLTELDSAFKVTLKRYIGGSGLFPGDNVIQDLVGGNATIANALKQVNRVLNFLGGDLYQAAIGAHVYPIDVGTAPNEAAALAMWNELAADTQDQLKRVLGYMTTWGPLPGLMKAGQAVLNPLNWPWYLKLAAAGAVVFYGSKFIAPILGAAGGARATFRALPGYGNTKRSKRRRKR